MIIVGKYKFYLYHVCFHFVRDNIYSPWQTIGVVTTNPIKFEAFYLPEYDHYKKAFDNEFKSIDNQNVASSFEAIDNYRKRYQQPFDVMSPVIKYYTSQAYDDNHGNSICRNLWRYHVDNNSLNEFRVLTLMLRLKDAFFATIFKAQNWHREDMIKELVAAGYMDE